LDLVWVLDDADQQRLFTMPPATFLVAVGGNPRDRFLALAHTAWLRGDTLRARIYADSALPFAATMARKNPTNADAHGLLANIEAYRGHRAEAVRDGHEAIRLAELRSESFDQAYARYQLARAFTVLHEPDSAAATLEPVPSLAPDFQPAPFLRVDPTWTSLRANPRFERLTAAASAGSASRP
jgi:hypothetical protein